jgi:hypothetical protein
VAASISSIGASTQRVIGILPSTLKLCTFGTALVELTVPVVTVVTGRVDHDHDYSLVELTVPVVTVR